MKTKKIRIIKVSILLIIAVIAFIVGFINVSHDPAFICLIILGGLNLITAVLGSIMLFSGVLGD